MENKKQNYTCKKCDKELQNFFTEEKRKDFLHEILLSREDEEINKIFQDMIVVKEERVICCNIL